MFVLYILLIIYIRKLFLLIGNDLYRHCIQKTLIIYIYDSITGLLLIFVKQQDCFDEWSKIADECDKLVVVNLTSSLVPTERIVNCSRDDS